MKTNYINNVILCQAFHYSCKEDRNVNIFNIIQLGIDVLDQWYNIRQTVKMCSKHVSAVSI